MVILIFIGLLKLLKAEKKFQIWIKKSLKPLCKKAIDNLVEYTSTSSTMSESKSEDLDSSLKSNSEISSNKHISANVSCVDLSKSCSTDDDCNSINDSNTLKSSKTLKYKININNDLERYLLEINIIVICSESCSLKTELNCFFKLNLITIFVSRSISKTILQLIVFKQLSLLNVTSFTKKFLFSEF